MLFFMLTVVQGANSDEKARCQKKCQEMGDPPTSACDGYRRVMPFPKVQHACEDALEMGKENGCYRSCGVSGGNKGACGDQRNEPPKPTMYKACMAGLRGGEQWAKVEFEKRNPKNKPKPKAKKKLPEKATALLTKAGAKAPKVGAKGKKFRKKPVKKDPLREAFQTWVSNINLDALMPSVKDLLEAGNIDADADKTMDLKKKRIEDTLVIYTKNDLTRAKIAGGSVHDLKHWNDLLHYPLTYDGADGDPLAESDLKDQLLEVLPMIAMLGDVVTKSTGGISEADI